jgi:hypothetical protein
MAERYARLGLVSSAARPGQRIWLGLAQLRKDPWLGNPD